MQKLKTICRSDVDLERETKFDIQKVFRNCNPAIHKFQKAREYQRAVISTKMEKIFAKPFTGALTGHSDSISVLAKCPNNLIKLLSGAFDGEVAGWDLSLRKRLF